MHDRANELLRIPIPRTRVNKARECSVVLLPEGWLPLNDNVRQTLPGYASAS
jgi:hypothetical protein